MNRVQFLTNDLVLRIALIAILFMHSVPGMFDGSVNAFGTQYLDAQGFAPFGLILAWTIKLSHIICAICLGFYRYLWIPILINIIIFTVGIIMIHGTEGWFVVGGGRNGAEYNILLIAAFIQILINYNKDNAYL